MKKLLPLFMLIFAGYPAFCIECPDGDIRLVIDDTQEYNDTQNTESFVNKLQQTYSPNYDLFQGGDFGKKDSSGQIKTLGISKCLNTMIGGIETKFIGHYCWCNLKLLDGQDVSSKWFLAKNYDRKKFDEEKYRKKKNVTETMVQQEKAMVNMENEKECIEKCAQRCYDSISKLKENINGYYICDKAKYKLAKSECVIDGHVIDNIEYINVFDDVAEISMKRGNIIFTRDFTNTKHIIYQGEYNNKPLYLQIKDKKIYVGRETFSMDKCISR